MQRVKPTNLITRAEIFGRKRTIGRVIFPLALNHSCVLGLLGLLLVLLMTACGAVGTPETASQDISIEAQAVATVTPVSAEEATAEAAPAADSKANQDSTSTELPTEIIEPLSPLSSTVISEANDSMAGTVEEMVKAMETIPGSEEVVAAAIMDLIQQTGVTPEEVTLASVEAREWSDTSLGCPQEGYMYAQVITPGYQIVLEAQGSQYNYHTDSASTVVLCQE